MTADLAPRPWLAPDRARGHAVHAAALATVARLDDPEPALLREPCRVGCSMCLAILDRRSTLGVQR